VKVGHRQAITASESPTLTSWAFCFCAFLFVVNETVTDKCNVFRNQVI
jgi:hypothetical protein